MKRIIAILLSMTICLSLGAGLLTAEAAYDESTYKLTGNQAADVVGIALTQVGYKESGNNNTKYGAWYGRQTAWCDIFVAWCVAKANVPQSVVPIFGGAENGMNWFKNRGLYKSASGYTPKVGDIAFFDWNYNNSPDHVGIVSKVSSSGIPTVVSGNMSDSVVNREMGTSSSSIYFNKKSIIGYGTPNYSGSGTVPTPPPAPKPTEVDAYYKVKVSAGSVLNVRSNYDTSSSITSTMTNGAIFHINKTVETGGYIWGNVDTDGKAGWCALTYATLVANKKDITITTNASMSTLKMGESLELKVEVKPAAVSTEGVVWSSSNASVVSVSGGKITAHKAGRATVAVKTALGNVSSSVSVTVLAQGNNAMGDIDGDGKATLSDIVALQNVIMNKMSVTETVRKTCDVNGDNSVNLSDIVSVRNIIMGK